MLKAWGMMFSPIAAVFLYRKMRSTMISTIAAATM
jgi:hypothetical protein